jgi:hypothetical protein
MKRKEQHSFTGVLPTTAAAVLPVQQSLIDSSSTTTTTTTTQLKQPQQLQRNNFFKHRISTNRIIRCRRFLFVLWKFFTISFIVTIMIKQLVRIRVYVGVNVTTTSNSIGVAPSTDWHVFIAHEPRYDLLGSFVIPTVLLYAVTSYHGTNWELVILPFSGSQQHAILQSLVQMGNKIDKAWGTGFQDASHRHDYDPVQLNIDSYSSIGFFPSVSHNNNIRNDYPWIRTKKIPSPGNELNKLCKKAKIKVSSANSNNRISNNTIATATATATTTLTNTNNNNNNNNNNKCYILLTDEPKHIRNHIKAHGGMDTFFTPTFCKQLRSQFLQENSHRLQKYETNITTTCNDYRDCNTTTYFNVAMHVRRGDILSPDRWTDQSVFAKVGHYICTTNTKLDPNIKTNIHVFSSGPNRDGNWSILENLSQRQSYTNNSSIHNTPEPPCAGVYFHLDEIEFDSWTYMVAADALVISKSTFSYVPALIRYWNVYMPNTYWYPSLSSFRIFNDVTGEIIN